MTKNREPRMNEILKKLFDSVVNGDLPGAERGVKQNLEKGLKPEEILNKSLIPAMSEVGERFERNEFYVPELLIAARAMQGGLNILQPLLEKAGFEPRARVALGTVKGDLHDIGKNLVAMMMKGAGMEVIDLGTDVVPEKFVEAASKGAQLLGMSALLTTTMPSMKETLAELTQKGLRDKVRVIIGGAPLTQAYADQIGADGYAPDASSAVKVAKVLLDL